MRLRLATDDPPTFRIEQALNAPRSSDVLRTSSDRSQQTTDDVVAAFETMSRRIQDLARELNCLGYFEDDDVDRPRAA